MGLDIKNYSWSYGVLQQLRQKALDYEGIDIPIHDFYFQCEIPTRFNEFIHHCDCEGYYVSKSSKRYEALKAKALKRFGVGLYFGDLDKLKVEVQELNNYMLDNTKGYLQNAWVDFYGDVMSSRKFLEFR